MACDYIVSDMMEQFEARALSGARVENRPSSSSVQIIINKYPISFLFHLLYYSVSIGRQ